MKTLKTKKGWILIFSILVLGLVGFVQADHNYIRFFANKQLAEKMDLTDEQMKSWEEIRYQSEKTKIDVQADLKKAQLDLRHELQKDDVDKNKVLELTEEVGKHQTELKKISLSNLIEVKEILTPEQKEEAKELLAKWKAQRIRMKQQKIRQKKQPARGRSPIREEVRKKRENRKHDAVSPEKRLRGEESHHRHGMERHRGLRHSEAWKPARPKATPKE